MPNPPLRKNPRGRSPPKGLKAKEGARMDGKVTAESGPVKFIGCGKLHEVEVSNGKQDSNKKELALSANGSEGIVFKNCATSSNSGLTITASDLVASAGPVEFSGCGKDEKTLDVTGNIQGNSVKVGGCGFRTLKVGKAVIATNGDCDIVDCANLGTINLNANGGIYCYAGGRFLVGRPEVSPPTQPTVGCPKLTTFDSKSIAADRVLFIGCGSDAGGGTLEVHGDIRARNDSEREYGVSFEGSCFNKYLIDGSLVAGALEESGTAEAPPSSWEGKSLIKLSEAVSIPESAYTDDNLSERLPLVAVRRFVVAKSIKVHGTYDDYGPDMAENRGKGIAYFKAHDVYLDDWTGNEMDHGQDIPELAGVVAFDVPGVYRTNKFPALRMDFKNGSSNIRCFRVGRLDAYPGESDELAFENGRFDLACSNQALWHTEDVYDNWKSAKLARRGVDSTRPSFFIGIVDGYPTTTIRFGNAVGGPCIDWAGFSVNADCQGPLRWVRDSVNLGWNGPGPRPKPWGWGASDPQQPFDWRYYQQYAYLKDCPTRPSNDPPTMEDYYKYKAGTIWKSEDFHVSYNRFERVYFARYIYTIAGNGKSSDRCVLDFQKLENGSASDCFGGDEMALAKICAKTINVNPAGFNTIDIKAPTGGGRFVCGTLDASRQGDGGTALESVTIADGVDGSVKVDYRYEWQQINSFTKDFREGCQYDDFWDEWEHYDDYEDFLSNKTYAYLANYFGEPKPIVISGLPTQQPGVDEYRRSQNGIVWSVIEDNPETFDPPQSAGPDETISCIHHCTIRQYTVKRTEQKTPGSGVFHSNYYILDNLIVANDRMLNNLEIPAIKGVDAHDCEFKSRDARVSIGGRDYIGDIQTDWGTTENLCLYGNGISFDRSVYAWAIGVPYVERLANGDQGYWGRAKLVWGHWEDYEPTWRGRAFSYKSGVGSYDAREGNWNALPDGEVVLEKIQLWEKGKDSSGSYVSCGYEIDIHTNGLDPNLVEMGGWRIRSDGTSYRSDYTKVAGYDPHRKVCGNSVSFRGNDDWKPIAEAPDMTKGDLSGVWDGYKDKTLVSMSNWVKGQCSNNMEAAVFVCPFGK